MKIEDLFILHQGNGFELIHIVKSENSEINFISRTSQNNGVVDSVEKVENKKPFPAGYISVALGGSVLSSFVQLRPFYTSFHIMVLEPKKQMSLQEKLYYCMCIKENAYKYNYGRQANKTLKDIILPDVIPEWVYSISVEPIKTKIKKMKLLFDINKWGEFKVGELFHCATTKPMIETQTGSYPYITRSALNNGVSGYTSTNDYYLNKGDCITIGAEGRVAFYQNKNFVSGVKIYTLRGEMINKYTALFICTILNCYLHKYSYGRARILDKIKDEVIKLPITKNQTPDWVYMEKYIKSLPYSDIV